MVEGSEFRWSNSSGKMKQHSTRESCALRLPCERKAGNRATTSLALVGLAGAEVDASARRAR